MHKSIGVLCVLTLLPLLAHASTTSGTIDASFKLNRVCKDVSCTTFGNLNWKPTINVMTPGALPVTIADTAITGHVWGDEIGWVKLAQTGLTGPQTLKVNPTTGVVTGFAYSSGGSWINFSPTQATTSTTTVGVTINSVGEFVGWAWASGAYGGWVKFDCAGVGACVKTDWRPIANREACQNGIDDDSDGQTDFPSDSGCTSVTATTEVNVVVPSGGGGGGGTFGGILPPGVTNPGTNNPNAGTNTSPKRNTDSASQQNIPSYVPENGLQIPKSTDGISPKIITNDIRDSFTVGVAEKTIPPVVRNIQRADGTVTQITINELPTKAAVSRTIKSNKKIVSVKSSFEYNGPVANYAQKTVYTKRTLWQRIMARLTFSLVSVAYAEEYVNTESLIAPEKEGLYKVKTNIVYDGGVTEMREAEVSVLPQGQIFYRPAVFFSNEIAVVNAKVTLFRQDEKTQQFVPVPLEHLYGEMNQVMTNANGEYVFTVGTGTYKLLVENNHKNSFESEAVVVSQEAQVFNDRIEFQCSSWWYGACAWDIKIIIVLMFLFLYRNYRHNTKKVMRAQFSTRK